MQLVINRRGVGMIVHFQRYDIAGLHIAGHGARHRRHRMHSDVRLLRVEHVISGDVINRHSRNGVQIDDDMSVRRPGDRVPGRIGAGYGRNDSRVGAQVINADLF